MAKANDGETQRDLALAVKALAPRADGGAASVALRRMLNGMAKMGDNDGYEVRAFEETVDALAPRLEPAAVPDAARRAHELARGPNQRPLHPIRPGRGVDGHSSPRRSRAEAARRAGSRSPRRLGRFGFAPILVLDPHDLASSYRPLHGPCIEQQLVDLLKTPPCQSPACDKRSFANSVGNAPAPSVISGNSSNGRKRTAPTSTSPRRPSAQMPRDRTTQPIRPHRRIDEAYSHGVSGVATRGGIGQPFNRD